MRPVLRSLSLLALTCAFAPRLVFAGGAITSGTIVTGTLSSPDYSESWTFSGTAGDRIIIAAVTTSGLVNTNIILHPPFPGIEYQGSNDRFDWQLLHTGTYTIEIQDVGLNDAGTYSLGFTNVTAGPLTNGSDLDGGPITSADVISGTTSGVADIDAFTFTASNGDRIMMDCVATSGVGYNTVFYLYPPNGGAPLISNFGDQSDVQLTSSGTWTMAVEDAGDDTAGSYMLSLLNITSGPHSSVADPDGGAMVSGEIYTGQFNQGVDLDAWTFTANAGDRIIVGDLPTGGGSQNTVVAIFPPGGGGAVMTQSNDRFDFQIAQTGTYTIVIQDSGLDNTGAYTLAILNVTSGPHTSGSDPDGAPIASTEVTGGTTSGVADFDAFTFTASAGDRVMIDCFATSGAGYNTTFYVYPPNGGPPVLSTFNDIADVLLNATGTWTIVVEDAGEDNSGSYALSLLNITSGPLNSGADPDGGAIVSGDTYSGQFNQGVDLDAWTFTANAGDRVIILDIPTGGGTQDPTVSVFPPGGGSAVAINSNNRFDVSIAQTGTYTLVFQESGLNDTGTYAVAILNVTSGPYTNPGDLDGGTLASSEVTGGTTGAIADMDAFTFTGNSGDRVLVDCVATSGVGYNTSMYLYGPSGASLLSSTFGDLIDAQLNATGTWTVVVEDVGDDTPGTYSMSMLNVTAGPFTSGSDPDAGTIVSDQIRTGQMQQGVDFDAWQFTGSANDRVIIAGVATGGGSNNTQMAVYPPGGGAALTTNSNDRFDLKLAASGTYTIVMEDQGFNDTGGYALSMMNVTAGPYTDGADSNGGPIVSNQIISGTTSGAADMDAFTFEGTNGDRLLMSAVATGGTGYNTTIYLYPPLGGSVVTSTFGDRLEYKLNATGTWVVVIEDNADDTAGSYNLSVLDANSGPFSDAADPDGGPMLVGPTLAGTIVAPTDFDGFTFTGYAGQNAAISAVTTSGAMNTYISVYPPGGGTALMATTTDNFVVPLSLNGTYTVVVEDLGQDQTGTYGVSVSLSGGPTGVGDTPALPLALLPAYPSPFNAVTHLDYTLPAAAHVQMRVYDVRGALVRTLVDGNRGVGMGGVVWDGADDHGVQAASGVYYVHFNAGGEVRKQKVVLVR
ncbi:MAG TPA: FlgD immunoglobulin-like domain containing protein [Candidatus Krumholzibacteria bacterium]|nr:FlgD immunoglobulin-like domain containing protein [Candidatus Krumholzibacteria bacterium]